MFLEIINSVRTLSVHKATTCSFEYLKRVYRPRYAKRSVMPAMPKAWRAGSSLLITAHHNITDYGIEIFTIQSQISH